MGDLFRGRLFHQVKLQSLLHTPVSCKEALADACLTTVILRTPVGSAALTCLRSYLLSDKSIFFPPSPLLSWSLVLPYVHIVCFRHATVWLTLNIILQCVLGHCQQRALGLCSSSEAVLHLLLSRCYTEPDTEEMLNKYFLNKNILGF